MFNGYSIYNKRMTKRRRRQANDTGMGVAKALLKNFDVSKTFDLSKVPSRLVQWYSYLEFATAAELQRRQSDM